MIWDILIQIGALFGKCTKRELDIQLCSEFRRVQIPIIDYFKYRKTLFNREDFIFRVNSQEYGDAT